MIDMSYNSCPRESNYQSAKSNNPCNFTTLFPKTPGKPKEDHLVNKNMKMPKNKTPNEVQNNDKVIMSKKQLMEFTKKFALHKVDYEQEIEFLKSDCKNKTQKIEVLQEQIKNVKTQEDYLIEVIDQLREKCSNQISTVRNSQECQLQAKQKQIDFLQQQITKIRGWLDEQKAQTKRCLDFIKLKDEIIEKLQEQIVKYKNDATARKEAQAHYLNFSNYNSMSLTGEQLVSKRPKISSSKKIILRRDKKQSNSKSQERVEHRLALSQQYKQPQQEIIKLSNTINGLKVEKMQIQDEKFQIFSKYRQVTIENDYLRRKIQEVGKQQKQQTKMKKSLHELDQITKRIKDSQHDKENLLVAKCLFLEKQVEKLAKELNDVKSSHVLSLSNFSSQVQGSESNLQFQK